jgi:hypothetical protein
MGLIGASIAANRGPSSEVCVQYYVVIYRGSDFRLNLSTLFFTPQPGGVSWFCSKEKNFGIDSTTSQHSGEDVYTQFYRQGHIGSFMVLAAGEKKELRSTRVYLQSPHSSRCRAF